MKNLHDDCFIKVGEMQNINLKISLLKGKSKFALSVSIGKYATQSQEQEKLIVIMTQLKSMKDAENHLASKLQAISIKDNRQMRLTMK